MTIYVIPFMQNIDMEELLFIQLYSHLHAKTNKPEISIQTHKNNQWLNSSCQHDTTSNVLCLLFNRTQSYVFPTSKFKNVPSWKSIFAKQQISVHIIQYYISWRREGFTWKSLHPKYLQSKRGIIQNRANCNFPRSVNMTLLCIRLGNITSCQSPAISFSLVTLSWQKPSSCRRTNEHLIWNVRSAIEG